MQYVYVLNKHGEPLMPCSPGKARILLKQQKACVVKRTPFTIKLLYGSAGYKQPITLGVDAGSKHVGLSASTEKRELYSEEFTPRNDVVELLSTRRQNRRSRRNRKTRYRAPRFNNRIHSKHKGWLAPSVEVKIQEHITVIKRICRILPITLVRVETAEFDTQRLKAMLSGKPLPVGTDYQLGEMYDEYNARCISKHPLAEPCSVCYRTKAIRHHNRQTHKANFSKKGIRKRSQMPYLVEGFRLWDKVLYKGQECFVSGRRSSGSFALKKLDGTSISKGVTFKKLRLLEPATNYLIERM